jgi:hypothetical protein
MAATSTSSAATSQWQPTPFPGPTGTPIR